MNTAVMAFFFEMRVVSEGMLISMLQDEVTAGMKQVMREYLVREGFQTFQGIRRVCENEVELFSADGK